MERSINMNNEAELLLSPSRTVKSYTKPNDRYHLVYLIFIFLGMACLLPWNFFITAEDYFRYKLRNTSLPEDMHYTKSNQTLNQRLFVSYLSITSMATNTVFMILTTLFIRSIPINIRMITSILIITVVFIETTILVRVDSDEWQHVFFILTLSSAAVVMAAVSVTTGSAIGLSCLFPVRYTQACMIGQAVGGTFSALARIFSIMGKGSETDSAFGFFLTASIISLLSLVAYGLLYRLRFSKFYLSNQIHAIQNSDNEIPAYKEIIGYREYITSIFRKIWSHTLCCFLTFIVTLSCFPSICSTIEPMHPEVNNDWTNLYFTPVACFLLFNIGDLLGRVFTTFLPKPSLRHKHVFLFLSILRVVYIPLLLYCNTGSKNIPVYFDHDVYPMIFTLTLGISNGYLSTLSFMFAPMNVPIEQAEGAGVIMALSLTMGLTVGALLSLWFLTI
ncbi:hypothetical protein LOTGIDRAFT_237985 [Lottia gigantea]|uniref:Major facilitator superfamily (MFS) profile domain-containing protein n=1 Tax=Lottia gigantea TaxID=225164 RepID=V4B4F6_LOTGI|nr:hypothetical protein LOTGIDRAFT_237985 [Lottia gigantea]ESP02346.1 hypothetical protein LOTGIDRAFT_237985 [Lottia gigantea]